MSDKENHQEDAEQAPKDDILDAEIIEEIPSEEKSVEVSEEETEAVESQPADEETPETPETPEPVTEQAPPSGDASSMAKALPLIVGGIAAGAIGFGASMMLSTGSDVSQEMAEFKATTNQVLESQAGQISALTAELQNFAPKADLAQSEKRISQAIGSDLALLEAKIANNSDALTSLQDSLAGISDRMVGLEKLPMEMALSEEVVSAYESEMAALREAIAVHRAEIEAIAEEARTMESDARMAESRVTLMTLVANLQSQAESGQPFSDELSAVVKYSSAQPSEALVLASRDGVPTLSALEKSFPDAARAALAAVRTEEAEQGGKSGLRAFLENQLGARSVEPKDGQSADAVLSRAEAALRAGDIQAALLELEALSETAKPALVDWMARARSREDALAEINVISTQVSR